MCERLGMLVGIRRVKAIAQPVGKDCAAIGGGDAGQTILTVVAEGGIVKEKWRMSWHIRHSLEYSE